MNGRVSFADASVCHRVAIARKSKHRPRVQVVLDDIAIWLFEKYQSNL